MRIGYACLTVGVRDVDYKSCIQKNATEDKLRELISFNLEVLKKVILYNIENHIFLFRISSDIIPFASSPVNQIKWWQEYHDILNDIGSLISNNKMRVSMHPGQYTVLNSPNPIIVERAIADLVYHTAFLDQMGLDSTHKIILHIGGVYQYKKEAMERFVQNYRNLPSNIKARLVIENDDKLFNVEDVLAISSQTGIPVVYDNLHNYANPSNAQLQDRELINQCQTTWHHQDGPQKIHYSEQAQDKRVGSHSHTIHFVPFLQFYASLKRDDLDIMLEVKDKNLSAIKINNLLHQDFKIKILEEEWKRYKYLILEKSQSAYNRIRSLLKDKKQYPVQEFYQILEPALEKEVQINQAVNAASHVWGYFKKIVDEKTKLKFMNLLNQYQLEEVKLSRIKNFLQQLTEKYQDEYLLSSYYFLEDTKVKEGADSYG